MHTINIHDAPAREAYLQARFDRLFARAYHAKPLPPDEDWDIIDSHLCGTAEQMAQAYRSGQLTQQEAGTRKQQLCFYYLRDKTQRLLAAEILRRAHSSL